MPRTGRSGTRGHIVLAVMGFAAGTLLAVSSAAEGLTRIDLCNEGDTSLRVAVVFQSLVSPPLQDRWIAHGWLEADPGRCVMINQASLDSPAFLHFSHQDREGRPGSALIGPGPGGGTAFSASHRSFCVRPGPSFARTGSPEGLASCPGDWVRVPFPVLVTPAPGTQYTLTLPKSPSAHFLPYGSDNGTAHRPRRHWKITGTRLTGLGQRDFRERAATALDALESIQWPVSNGSRNGWGRTWQHLLEARSYPEFSDEELEALHRNAMLELEVLPRETFAECRDRFLAYQILHLVALKGHEHAQLRLGELWDANGECWPSNPYLATHWYRKAALQGNAEARSRLDR